MLRRLRALVVPVAVLASWILPAAASALPLGVRIMDAPRVLAEHSVADDSGNLYLRDAQGQLRPFITSASDPAIPNAGDGAFHAASADLVERALDRIDPRFIRNMAFDVYILPYPVTDPMGSWAAEHTIYVSPGVREMTEEQVHFLISHEAGHLVHRTFLPDSDVEGWSLYRELRGITDSTRYSEQAPHRDRPHEIFAEDFRILFGSDLGAAYASAENDDLADARSVPGLREFFLQRSGIVENSGTALACGPNPFRPGRVMTLRTDAVGPADVALYDVTGRQVRSFEGIQLSGGGTARFTWDGRDDAGADLPAGTYFVRVATRTTQSAAAVTLLD